MSPQLPENVRSTMQALADGLRTVLGPRLLGVYLGGSTSMGDFQNASSDLDFLVVTKGKLSLEEALAVKLLHKALLRDYPTAFRLKGDYAPVALIVPDGTTEPVPGCERGVFLPMVGEIMLSADNIYNMYEHGIRFYGPSPREVLPQVSADQVRSAVRTRILSGPGPCDTVEELAKEVLNLLRSACAMETGQCCTKQAGADWAKTHLPVRWHAIIDTALRVRSGQVEDDDEPPLRDALPELDRVIRATV